MKKVEFRFNNDIKSFPLERKNLCFFLEQFPKDIQSKIIVAKLNNEKNVDLSYILQEEDYIVEWINIESQEGEFILRHSSAHILCQAISRLYPGSKYGIGPAIENGFFYDIEIAGPISEDNLSEIEKEMRSITKSCYPFSRRDLTTQEALEIFKEKQATYKVDILNDIHSKNIPAVSIYSQGEFTDLCRGPHIPHTGYLKHFKLLSIAGAYWKNDSANPMLQRIYGVSFAQEDSLKEYLINLEEAKKRDHRVIGKNLGLFNFHNEATGMPFWYEKGLNLYHSLENLLRRINQDYGYKEVKTPIILNQNLWEKSGHYENFKEYMFFIQKDHENKNYAIKPMNCPGHALIYKNNLYSYKDLPIRISEFGLVHRNELSGVVQGLFRVRAFTQDDAHIFCSEENLKQEISQIIECILLVYKTLGFEKYDIFLATRPKKYTGTEEDWQNSISILKESLDDFNLSYSIKEGEGAFYGPKIEFNIKDCLNRSWQCGTVQLDFSLAKKLELYYRDKNNQKSHVISIHRAILGSMERFIAILIEHYAGNFPLWLSPIQVKIIPIHKNHVPYAKSILKQLISSEIRTEINLKDEKLSYKIREAETEKIPYIIIIGDNELKEDTITIRSRVNIWSGQEKKISDFILYLKEKNHEHLL